MGSASFSSPEEGDSAEHHAPLVVEGPVLLEDSSDDDEDEVPLARRSPAPKRKVTESPRCADPPSFPIEEEAGSLEYADFIRAYRSTKRAKGVKILLEDEGPEPLPEAEVTTAEAVPMPEDRAAAIAVDQQEIGLVAGDDTSIADIASFEVPVGSVEEVVSAAADVDLMDRTEPAVVGVPSVEESEPVAAEVPLVEESEPVAAEVPLVEETETAAAGVRSGEEIETVAAGVPLVGETEPAAAGVHPVEETETVAEVTSAPGEPDWWRMVGFQEDPVLGLRHQIEDSLVAVDSLGRHLSSGEDSFREWKRRLEAREEELKAARSTIAALEARNFELEGASARYEERLSTALERQGVLEAKSSEYDQLRSAVDVGQARIDGLTSDVIRLDRANAELEGLVADLRVRLTKAAQVESELVDRSSRLQRSFDEQRGTIAGFEAEVSNLSRNLCSIEAERDSARRGLGDAQRRVASLENEMVALKQENKDLSSKECKAIDSANRFMQGYKDATQLAKKYKHQLDVVYLVRNRTWVTGYEWGIETMREMSMSDRHKHRVPTVKIEEIFPDPRALEELKEIGVVELPDARFMSSIPRPAAARRRTIEAGGSSMPKVAADSGSEAEPSAGGSAPS